MSKDTLWQRWFGKKKAEPKRASARDNFFQALGGDSGYQGAKLNRLTGEWNPQSLSPSSLHRLDGAVLRQRARDLVMNNPLAKSAVGAYIANTIECGITPKPRFDSRDTRRLWADAWSHWGDHEADITGCQGIYELQAMWLEEVITAGGCLMHFRVLGSRQMRGRRNRAAVELIPEERLCDDRDTFVIRRNNTKSKNPITGGVEVDASTGRPVAFWVKPWHPNDSMATGSIDDPIRLSASNTHYAFFKKRIGQYRGVTMLHAIVMQLWRLGYYTDNELMASAIKSLFAAIIVSDKEDDELADDDTSASGATDAYGNPLEKLQPAMIARLRAGEDIRGVGPNVPGGDSTPWLQMMQRLTASGADLSYEELVRDYSQTTFSSNRAGANADRKRFRPMQKFTVNHFCKPVWRHFVEWSVFAGTDGFPSPAAFVADPDTWLAANWRAPGWAQVNPKDESQSDDVRLNNNSRTLDDIVSAEGGDWEETLEQRALEKSRTKELEEEFDIELEPEPVNQMAGNDGDEEE